MKKGIYAFRSGKKWGYRNNGIIIVPEIYDEAYPYISGHNRLAVKNGKYTVFYNLKGEIFLTNMVSGEGGYTTKAFFALTEQDGINRNCFVNSNLEVIDLGNFSASYYNSIFFLLKNLSNNESGIINENGEILLKPGIYSDKYIISNFGLKLDISTGIAAENAQIDTKFFWQNKYNGELNDWEGYFVDKNGIRDQRFNYKRVFPFNDKLSIAPVMIEKDKWIYINERNEQISKRAYFRASIFSNFGYAKVIPTEKDLNGFNFDRDYNSSAMQYIQRDEHWPEKATFGYIDTEGNEYWED